MEQDDPASRFDVPPEQALLVIDMQGYSKIPEAKMAPARSDVDDILDCVLALGGLELPQEGDSAWKDTGDGVILAFAPHVLARLIDPVLSELNAALVRYERQRLSGAPLIRLRASVHVGPLSLPDRRGDAINEACRLISCKAVYHGLAAAADSGGFLAAVVSETAYRRTVAAGRTPQLSAHHFLPTLARVEGKPDFAELCRLHVPGLTEPGLRPYVPDANAASDEGHNGGAERLSRDSAPAHEAASGGHGAAPGAATFQFHGSLHQPTIAGEIKKLRIDQRGS
ncbi:hypothetical protein [Streptomyces sp. NPDC007063]|uniref:hypothetical protein n=1 Tax=Streptomyces sp. NPDC007063 TaxID=3364772 RepID=UPI0036AE797F